jgi:hypothetical protein
MRADCGANTGNDRPLSSAASKIVTGTRSRRTSLSPDERHQVCDPGSSRGGGRPTLWGMSVRIRVAAALAALLVGALAGCHSGSVDPAASGPLASGSGKDGTILRHGGECVTRFYGRNWAFGIAVFTNYGHATVVLDRVVLLHPRNERLIGSDVVPGPHSVIGAIAWPPNWPSVRAAWKTRQPVAGYRVAPGKSFEMVLGVTYAGPGNATSDGMQVFYHDAAGRYVAPNYFGMQIAAGGENACG